MNNPTKKPPGVIPVGKRTLRETREASPQAPTNPSPSGAESEPSVTAKKKVARPAVAILIAFALSVFSALGAATTNRPGVISPGSTSNPNAAYQIQANAAGYFTNPTNANLGSADIGVIYVDSIVGSDSTGTGTSWKPYATLTKAQTVAINGQTIYGVRGTFAENSLGKNGVSWYFNDGVFLSSSGAFSVGTNNGVTNLTVRGLASGTNSVVFLFSATNSSVDIEMKSVTLSSSTSSVFVEYTPGLSNKFYFTADDVTGNGAVLGHTTAVTNTYDEFYITGRKRLHIKPEVGSSNTGNSNTLFVLKAPRVHLSAGSGSSPVTSLACVQIKADWLTREGPITAVQSNYFFNVNVLSTNDLNTNIAGLKGIINVVR